MLKVEYSNEEIMPGTICMATVSLKKGERTVDLKRIYEDIKEGFRFNYLIGGEAIYFRTLEDAITGAKAHLDPFFAAIERLNAQVEKKCAEVDYYLDNQFLSLSVLFSLQRMELARNNVPIDMLAPIGSKVVCLETFRTGDKYYKAPKMGEVCTVVDYVNLPKGKGVLLEEYPQILNVVSNKRNLWKGVKEMQIPFLFNRFVVADKAGLNHFKDMPIQKALDLLKLIKTRTVGNYGQ